MSRPSGSLKMEETVNARVASVMYYKYMRRAGEESPKRFNRLSDEERSVWLNLAFDARAAVVYAIRPPKEYDL